MRSRRPYHDPLAQASYLLACQASREAIVIDPLRDSASSLEAARQEGVRTVAVTETLVHCQGGSRSAVAASVRLAAGFADVANAEGGYTAWQRAGHRAEHGA